MFEKKSAKPAVSTILLLAAAVLGVCGYFIYSIDGEVALYENTRARIAQTFEAYTPDPFIHSAAGAAPYTPEISREDALYYYDAPEGFSLISMSSAWNREMLRLLYDELKLNTHGDEIEKLYEIVIHPHANDEANALATYTPGISAASFYVQFPAFPDDFSVDFPIVTGKINIYGGDTNTTIESIAGSLAHEYGHHYTFYYMFDHETRGQGSLDDTRYAMLRDAEGLALITNVDIGEDYLTNRHRYLIEVAAEDYVTLMGSPTTRQVADYFDVRQLLENPELDGVRRGERNAFPQENMMIPLGIDVPGLSEYFHSYIGAAPRVPIEEKQDIMLDIRRESIEFNLQTGPRTFVHYAITWNAPYTDAIYTLACYDRYDYSGWGIPIKTVRPDAVSRGSASAVVGEYAIRRGNTIHFRDDGIAEGIKVFYVVAQLPDGTYYTSEPYFYNFE